MNRHRTALIIVLIAFFFIFQTFGFCQATILYAAAQQAATAEKDRMVGVNPAADVVAALPSGVPLPVRVPVESHFFILYVAALCALLRLRQRTVALRLRVPKAELCEARSFADHPHHAPPAYA